MIYVYSLNQKLFTVLMYENITMSDAYHPTIILNVHVCVRFNL